MRLWRYTLAALVYDAVVFVVWVVIPIRAHALGAGATPLGLLVTVHSVLYTVNSLLMGRLADRASKPLLALLGCAGAASACLILRGAERLETFFVGVPILALSASLFWPSIQGSIGAETPPHRMERALGLFNVMWSIGKSLGFLSGGWLVARAGPAGTLALAAALAGAVALFYPWTVRPHGSPENRPSENGHPAFRTLGYISNFVAYGVAAAFQTHFFAFLERRGLGRSMDPRTFFGLFLGVVFAAQTAGFAILQHGSGWTYRRAWLYGSQGFMAAAAVALIFVRSDWGILAAAPALGLCLSFAYASSLYYSLHNVDKHGKYSGIHEAVLGAGNFLVPLVGGVLADRFGDLRAPYLLAAAGALGAIALQETVYRRISRSREKRSIVKSAPSSSPGCA
jgi:predicted MFS family arabinose efflux permease